MAVLSTFNTNWQELDLVTADDLNRIEGNSEYANNPNIGSINSAPNSTMSAASFTVVGSTVNHLTYTGRVLLTGHFQIETTSLAGGNPDISLTVTHNGTNVVSGNQLARQIISAIGYYTVTFGFVVTGLTPGSTETWDVRYAKNAGNNTIARYVRLSVIDI